MAAFIIYRPTALGGGGGGGGVTSVGPFGNTPNADGGDISGSVLTLEPADGTHPGGVSITTQTFAGNKTFTGTVIANILGSHEIQDFSAVLAIDLDNRQLTDNVGNPELTWSTTGLNVPSLTASRLVATDASKNLVSQATGNLTDVGTDGIVITGGTGSVVGSGTSIAQHVADTTHNGYLSSTDWNTFNSKQPAGNYITALTGDGTATGPGSVPFTLATVNSNVGSFSPAAITVNGKGLVTAASNVTTGNLTDVGTDGITVAGGTGAVLGSGTSLSQHVADTTHNGYLSSTDWNTFNIVSNGPGDTLYVDQNHPGTYTADGSVLRPFLTITAAINKIISNNNGQNYAILVYPGTYTENLTFNNTAFTRVAVVGISQADGDLSNNSIPVTSLVGNISSNASNDNFKAFIVNGIDIQGNIDFTGASNGTNFLQYGGTIANCTIYSQAAPALNFVNAGQVVLQNVGTAIAAGAGGVTITNVVFTGVYSTFLNLGTIAITTNGGGNKPSGYSSTGVQTSFGNRIGSVTVDSGSNLVQRFNRNSGTLTSSGTITSINSAWGSGITLNAGSMSSFGDSFASYPTLSGGTFTPSSVSSGTYYGPNANPATAGILRLSSTDAVDWRNNANSGNVALAKDTSDQLSWNGTSFLSSSAVLLAAAFPILTGDVTTPGGSLATTIANNVVTNAKLAQMAAHTYKGNNTGSTANALDVTSTQLTADLNLFTSSLQGLVPGSGGGTTNFLRADGTWSPAGTGTVTSVALTVPAFLSVSGSPVTSSGTLAVSLSGTALPVANGGTGVTSVTTSPTATAFAGWDANSNLSAHNFIQGYTTTVTAAGTTTLLVGSSYQQYLTGSTTQTVALPVTSTLVTGQAYQIVNNSTGTVTVNSSGGNLVQSLPGGTSAIIVCISTSGTTAASWSVIPTSTGNYTVDTFSGDNSTTGFTLSVSPASVNNTQVFISGVYQFKSTYSVSGTTITFTTAPPTGTNNIQVVSGTSLSIGTPADGTVTPAKLSVAAAVYSGSLTNTTANWSTTSSSFTDLTAPGAGSNVLTNVVNSNMGTPALVTTGGVTLTLPTTAFYWVSAQINAFNSSTSGSSRFRLVDGSGTVIATGLELGTNNQTPTTAITLNGLYSGTAGSTTFKLQANVSTGTVNISDRGTGAPAMFFNVFMVR